MEFLLKLVFLIITQFYFTLQNDYFLNDNSNRNLNAKINFPKSHRTFFRVKVNVGEQNVPMELALDLTESFTWVENFNCQTKRILNSEEKVVAVKKNNTDTVAKKEVTDVQKNVTAVTKEISTSKTCTDMNKDITIETLNGELKGRVYKENLNIGGIDKANSLSIVSVSEEISNTYFGKLNESMNGVLGLSYKNFNGDDYNFLSGLKKTGSIKKRVFSLGRTTFQLGDYPTEVKQFKQNFHTCNITMNEGLPEELMDGWICDLTHFLVGTSHTLVDAQEIEGRVIFDSTLSNIIAPDKFLGIIKAHYIDLNYSDKKCEIITDENKSQYIACNEKIDDPKDLSFVIQGYSLIIPGEKLFVEELHAAGSKSRYILNIAFSNLKHNVWRFGKVFLDEYLMVFDGEKKEIGFYGENKINFEKEWNQWWTSGYSNITSQEHMKYLIIASSCLGVALLLVIICVVIQSLKNKNVDDEDHAQLQEEMESKS